MNATDVAIVNLPGIENGSVAGSDSVGRGNAERASSSRPALLVTFGTRLSFACAIRLEDASVRLVLHRLKQGLWGESTAVWPHPTVVTSIGADPRCVEFDMAKHRDQDTETICESYRTF